ncbi:hypothetical protein AB0J35_23140 [Nonomuraea angiospora]
MIHRSWDQGVLGKPVRHASPPRRMIDTAAPSPPARPPTAC